MSGQIDMMAVQVAVWLDRWAEAFALHRDGENLGYPSKNILYDIIRHKEVPPRATGYKPLTIDMQAMLIEGVVLKIARTDPTTAWVLRAYHCGRGRRRFERFDQANELLRRAQLPTVSVSSYEDLAKRGEQRISRILSGGDPAPCAF